LPARKEINMANRNDDRWYFGKLFDQAADDAVREKYAKSMGLPLDKLGRSTLDHYSYINERQEILSALALNPDNHWAFVTDVCFMGPAMCVHTLGKFGTSVDFTDESWKVLSAGVVVYDWFDAEETWGRSITIAGEKVMDEHRRLEEMREDSEWCAFTEYVGRTPEERAYFKALWAVIVDRRPVITIADGLRDIRKRKATVRA
jgi:hypothetical protein